MGNNWKSALWEAVKEPLRLLLMALVSWGIVYFTTIPDQWAVVFVFVLRFVDKLLHEIGKETDNSNLTTGLTRF